jgi:hypothetical protein
MDCRRFHRNLEDYLQDGLDFSGRFGMERHAQQCIRCGKDLADAQRLSQMARQLERVKAPVNFEASVLQEIGKRKLQGPFSYFYRAWVYGFDWVSWRKLAIAGCGAAALALGIVYWPRHVPAPTPNALPLASYVAAGPPKSPTNEREKPAQVVRESAMPQARPVARPDRIKPESRFPRPAQEDLFTEPEIADTEYMDYVVEGPDNRPVTVRLPKKIRMQYSDASEEYFIRNVSH